MTTDLDLAKVPPGWTASAWYDVSLWRSNNVRGPKTRKLYGDRAAAVLAKHGKDGVFPDEAPAVDLPPAVEKSIRLNNTGGDIEC